MLPGFAMHHLPYRHGVNPITLGKFRLPHRTHQAAYLSHLLLGQLSVGALLSYYKCSLFQRIMNVIFRCSQPKMSRIDAPGIVSSRTVMTDKQSLGYRAMNHLPAKAVRGDQPTVFCRSKLPVSSSPHVQVCRPLPARSTGLLVNVPPETYFRRRPVPTGIGAVMDATLCYSKSFDVESVATLLTDKKITVATTHFMPPHVPAVVSAAAPAGGSGVSGRVP